MIEKMYIIIFLMRKKIMEFNNDVEEILYHEEKIIELNDSHKTSQANNISNQKFKFFTYEEK